MSSNQLMKVYAGTAVPVAPHVPNSIHFVYVGENSVEVYINGDHGEVITDVLTSNSSLISVTKIIEDALMPGGANDGTTPLENLLGNSDNLNFVQDISVRDSLTLNTSTIVYVEDASDDPGIQSGSGMYYFDPGSQSYTLISNQSGGMYWSAIEW